MRAAVCWAIVWLGVLSSTVRAQGTQLVAGTEPLTAAEQLTKFKLPPGFKIELVAAEPDCRKPMNIKFDAAGRLYFTQSIEYPWPVKEGETGRDTIRVMTDTNGDGVPDQSDIFADGLNIPIGITPVGNGVLGYSIPTLYHFPDADRNMKADGRAEFYSSFGFRDTHGMCSSLNYWIDGWVYGCHGFANESNVVGKDGKPVVMQSGNTYRLRPDGSHIEYVSHGQVNPFGMCFDPLGNQFVSDCHTKPAYVILNGAYYPSFGKPHDGLGYGPELMQHLHGSTGIAGVVYYAAEHFPTEYRDNIFLGNPVTGRINRDTLAIHGSTYKAIEQPDFLTCDDPWFRPVDIQLAPDGSLYVADFYNRIIGHYEVPLTHPGRDRERGRIWRISYVGPDGKTAAPRIADLTQASVDDLIVALGHPHLAVRVLATNQLVDRIGAAAVAPVTAAIKRPDAPAVLKAHAVWVLERIGGLTHDIAWSLRESDRLVQVHLIKALASRPNLGETEDCQIIALLLGAEDPFVKRAAIECIGRHPGVPQIGLVEVIRVWSETPATDEALTHTARMAARNLLRDHPEILKVVLESREELVEPKLVPFLMEALLGLPRRDASQLLLQLLIQPGWPDRLAEPAIQHVVRHASAEDDPGLTVLPAMFRARPEEFQVRLLRAAQRGSQERGRPLPVVWTNWANEVATKLLAQTQDGPQRQGLEVIREWRLAELANTLTDWLDPSGPHRNVRGAVLETLAVVSHPDVVKFSTAVLTRPGESAELQQQVAQLLGGLNRDESRTALVATLKAAPQSQAIIVARALSLSGPGGDVLLSTIEQGKASPRLLLDGTVEQRLRAANPPQWEARRKTLTEGLPPEDARLQQLQTTRRTGFAQAQTDAARGAALFNKQCAICHKLNNQGAKVGPELDGIGLRGLDRLLEDTLDPNRNVDAAFRATVVATKAGKVLSGLVLREEGAVLILADDQGKEQQIPLDEIEERKAVALSPMPANVAEKLTEAEYFDLLAYLLTQRTGKPDRP